MSFKESPAARRDFSVLQGAFDVGPLRAGSNRN
jgi:hypothetical protein